MTFNKGLLSFVVILFAGFSSERVNSHDSDRDFKPQHRLQDHFIWKVSVNNCLFYLAGSVHLGLDTFYPLPDIYLECYRSSDVLVMELEEEFGKIEDQLLIYARKDRLTEADFFRHHLKDSTIFRIVQILGKDVFELYDNYEAWLLNMLIAGNRCRLAGYDPDFGIDKYFRELAKNDNKKVIGLDSLADQLRLMEFDVPYNEQVAILELSMLHIEAAVKLEIPFFAFYGTGDVEGFEAYFTGLYDAEDPVMSHTYNRVFASRNLKWVNKLEELSLQDKHTYMVVVGAGHFFGPSNILALLKSRGYLIEPL